MMHRIEVLRSPKKCAVLGALASVGCLAWVNRNFAAAATDVPPDNAGPWKVVAASWLGGPGDDEIVAAAIAPSGEIVLAGNSARLDWTGDTTTVLGQDSEPQNVAPPIDPKKAAGWHDPNTFGFIATISPDGTKPLHLTRFGRGAAEIRGMKLDGKASIVLFGNVTGGIKHAGIDGGGTFLARLTPDGLNVEHAAFQSGLTGFDVDKNGDMLGISSGHLLRWDPDGTQKWDVTYPSHGSNRPGGVGVSVKTGVAVVVGYGMTKTGREPFKDPYAHAFDRDGKLIWSLWNPDPKREQDAKYGGNGLMADTTGRGVGTDAAGNFYLTLYADGGNSVCTRDPLDPDKPLDTTVFDGVFQKSAGYGFHGASKTSVTFRADPLSGKLEKGTWMCAWPSPQHANGLGIEAITADDQGNMLIAGDSATGCPTKQPWYVAPEGGYIGGGFLAILTKNFQMQQCGYFPGSTIKCVAQRGNAIVIAGSAVAGNTARGKGQPDRPYPVPISHAAQATFGGGARDGYFVILKGPSPH